MRRNLGAGGGMASSERVLAAMAPVAGKHAAAERLQSVLGAARDAGLSLDEAIAASGLDGPLGEEALAVPDPGAAPAMVDGVIRRGRAARAAEPERWP